jgi:toxin ParE1/3/4
LIHGSNKLDFQARDDLRNIADYISNDSKRYARLQVVRLKNKTHLLKSHVRLCRIVPEINIENIRELIEGNYRIIYKIVSETQVDILTVHHSARDLTKREIK